MPTPPPMRDAMDAEWCGAMSVGTVMSGTLGDSLPAMEWMAVTSSASFGVSGGNSPVMRSANMVLPVPGGPTSSRLCAPAAETSSAHRASGWPTTSARSRPGAMMAGTGGRGVTSPDSSSFSQDNTSARR
jgi:hypothetical protein